jgi:two-component system, NtrC family, nitrogen regulation sensor histidine kinase NtrY
VRGLSGVAAAMLVGIGALAGLATFVILTGLTPVKPTEQLVRMLLILTGTLALLMMILVLGQVLGLVFAHRRGTPGTGLHLRIILLVSLIAMLPPALVGTVAAVTLNKGLDSWFSDRTRSIVDTATHVAEAYVTNASESTRMDAANIAADLVQQRAMYDSDRPSFIRRVARHAALRNLSAAYVLNFADRKVEVNVTANDTIKYIVPPDDAVQQATNGEAILIPPSKGSNLVRSIIKLQGYPNDYLYIYRVISPTVIDQLAKTQDAKAEYDSLMRQRSGVQYTFAIVYALVTLVFLLGAIWTALWFSNRLVAPIVRLLGAAREVAHGNFNVKVAATDGHGDLNLLSNTFNIMTDQVRSQRDELVNANLLLDTRRRFTEAMLAGVSAGVVGIGADHCVSLVNRSACTLLGQPENELVGKPIDKVHPEFGKLYSQAISRPSGFAEGQIETTVKGREVSFVARITTERAEDESHGFVLTFDDITDLVSAQRNSAWSDIARRIAHEIKNPLTPIQLSAERLKRKYSKEIITDPKVFEQCTDTIIRQVGDLGRIVDEFSSFARMPKAVPELNSLNETVQNATVLQRVSSSDIEISLSLAEEDMCFPFDRRLITQAVTNLVKNAREAIEARLASEPNLHGKITIHSGVESGSPYIRIVDNGIGLPGENRNRLAEPYITTREKGTGLGLAIVKRIMEEHGGFLILQDSPHERGAMITLAFAAVPENQIIVREEV